MTATTGYTLSSSAWSVIADGLSDVTIQRLDGDIKVYVGSAEPPLDADALHLRRQDEFFRLTDLDSTDKVYARSASPSGNDCDIVALTGPVIAYPALHTADHTAEFA